jgi:hypothetical protein
MEPRIPTVEETPPEQQTALLPVDTLKQLCLEKFYQYKIQEFRLQGGTQSLKAFLDFCFLENGKYDKNRIVWITENAFIRLGGYIVLPGDYRYQRFGLKLWATDDDMHIVHSPDYELYIHSSTTEEAIAALDLLAGLQDSYFKKTKLRYDGGRFGRRPICPLMGRHLEIFVRNANRVNTFHYMIFTRDQCRTLASTGTRTNIGFWKCRFEDEGIAFVEASAARENLYSGPGTLRFSDKIPFKENLRLFLSQNRLESLTLCDIRSLSEESCSSLAAAELQDLKLLRCGLADGGAALVESVREGRGPRGLTIRPRLFDSPERFISFIHALRGNTYLQRLDLSNDDYNEGSPQALASALLENKGLVHFGLDGCKLEDHCWSDLMVAISTHPTLRTLKFRDIRHVDGQSSSPYTKWARTQAVADMLLLNKHIDDIPFDYVGTFDRDDWNALVAPRVECNLYWKRCAAIQKIKAPPTRAAVVAQALARVEKKPSLVWMVLSQSHDVISTYRGTAWTRENDSISVPSRKRRYSPSADAMNAH